MYVHMCRSVRLSVCHVCERSQKSEGVGIPRTQEDGLYFDSWCLTFTIAKKRLKTSIIYKLSTTDWKTHGSWWSLSNRAFFICISNHQIPNGFVLSRTSLPPPSCFLSQNCRSLRVTRNLHPEIQVPRIARIRRQYVCNPNPHPQWVPWELEFWVWNTGFRSLLLQFELVWFACLWHLILNVS